MESQQYASINHSIPSRDEMSSQYSSLQRIPTSSRKTKNQHVHSQKFECIICQKSTSSCCSGCKKIFYCGPQHQILHWETHQFECIPTQEQEEEQQNSFLSNQSTRQPTSRKEEKVYPTPKETKQIKYSDNIADDLSNQRVHQDIQNNESDHYNSRSAREYSPPPQSSGRKSTKNFESPESSERKMMIQEALRSYSVSDCTQAIEKATNAYKLSQLICRQQNAQNSTNLVSDGLLLAKILINNDSSSEAKEILLEVWEVIQDVVKFTQLDPKDKESLEILESITLMLSTIAGLFMSISDFTNSEAAYLIYIKIMEAYFGNHSLEVSNCFFLVGVFYLEEKQYLKAMACFKKALRIREARYKDSEGHQTIADCHYNIGIIYKQTHKSAKALESLGNALRIREKQIGENSLPVAQVLEIMAKVHFGMEDYQQTFEELENCFLIRQKFINNSEHADLQRIKKFARILSQKVEDVLKESQISNDLRSQLKSIQNQILNSPMYSS